MVVGVVSNRVVSEKMSKYNLDEPTMKGKIAILNLINRELGFGNILQSAFTLKIVPVGH
jgi:hypothetical protein